MGSEMQKSNLEKSQGPTKGIKLDSSRFKNNNDEELENGNKKKKNRKE